MTNHSPYFLQEEPNVIIVLIYVDDLIILSNNVGCMIVLKSKLMEKYDMMDLGELHHCSGMEFVRDRIVHTITMHQGKYLKELLKRYHIKDCKLIVATFDIELNLEKLNIEEYDVDVAKIIGVPYKLLMYTMVGAGLDLAFAISMVSQLMVRQR